MNLNVFSAETLPTKHSFTGRGPRINFGKSGMINFSKPATQLMKIKVGDKVSLAQDDAHPEKWYFFKDPAGFILKDATHGGLWISHKDLVKTYVGAFDGDTNKGQRAVVSPEPVLFGAKKTGGGTEYWLIEFQHSEK